MAAFHLILAYSVLTLLAANSEAEGESAQLQRHSAGAKLCGPPKHFPAVPSHSTQYNGISWPELCYEGSQDEHIFLIGDYGGITCGHRVEGHDPNGWACRRSHDDKAYAKTADNTKDHPDRGRTFVHSSDARPQALIADQMRKRAPTSKPRFFLNGGDNFYFGGVDTTCGVPMNEIHDRTRVQFDLVFEKMYSGEGMDVPWFSTLGNHDFGGRKFDAAWDQQIAYTWASNTSKRWILPGMYWHQHVKYPSKGFTVDFFMVDTNKGDAKPWTLDKGHNICGEFNSGASSCKSARGPENRYSCHLWFDKLWKEQSAWLEDHLNKSTADWQIITTHFPPDQFQRTYWKELTKKYGIDLFVGSHRHMQEQHPKDRRFSNLNWVVVGGGGGITSEWNPGSDGRGRRQYGFMDLTISKTEITIDSINEHGYSVDEMTIEPRPAQGELSCKHYTCGGEYQEWQGCQCTADCWKYNSCCKDFTATCTELASCAAYGCMTHYDRMKPCQCTEDCVARGNCCSDWQDTCNTAEYREAKASCDTDCIDDKNQTHTCRERAVYLMKHRHKKAEDAIEEVAEDCAAQCACTTSILSIGRSSSSLAQETGDQDGDEGREGDEEKDSEKKAALFAKKLQLIEELAHIDEKLPKALKEAPLDNEHIWSDVME